MARNAEIKTLGFATLANRSCHSGESCPILEKSGKLNDENNFLEVKEKGMEDLFNSGMTQFNSVDETRKELVTCHQRPRGATTR